MTEIKKMKYCVVYLWNTFDEMFYMFYTPYEKYNKFVEEKDEEDCDPEIIDKTMIDIYVQDIEFPKKNVYRFNQKVFVKNVRTEIHGSDTVEWLRDRFYKLLDDYNEKDKRFKSSSLIYKLSISHIKHMIDQLSYEFDNHDYLINPISPFVKRHCSYPVCKHFGWFKSRKEQYEYDYGDE